MREITGASPLLLSLLNAADPDVVWNGTPEQDGRPAVAGLLETDTGDSPDALVERAIRANIRASADHLRHGSEILEQLIEKEGLRVVGAEYSLETGAVDFFDGV